MGLNMRLQPRLRQMLAKNCTVCRQIIDASSQGDGEALARAGAKMGWAQCPACLQVVEPPFSQGYKRRFVRWCVEHGIKPK